MISSIKNSFIPAIAIIKLIFPVLIILEILKYFQLIEPLSVLLSPILSLLELPNEFSIIWIVGLLTGVYGAIASFFYIIAEPQNYTVAEVSMLASLILIAHAVPIEAKISQYLGLSYFKTIFFRFFLSILFALLIKFSVDFFGLLQDKLDLISMVKIEQQEVSIQSIIFNPILICLEIGIIIIFLNLAVDFLKKIKVIYYIEIALKPIANFLKIDNRLTNSLLIGILLGLSYGSSLLMKDFKNLKNIPTTEKNKVIYFLNLSHALIEDTILVLFIGANIFVVLVARVLFSIFVILLIDLYYKKSRP